MDPSETSLSILKGEAIHVRFKISALWTAYMVCYVYGDILLFLNSIKPGDPKSLDAGAFGTQPMLILAVTLMAIPAVMIFLSLVLAPKPARYVNLVFGSAYTALIIGTTVGSAPFYMVLSVVEAPLTLLIVWYAWRWQLRTAINGDLDSKS
jgi:hypothetical protein